MQNQKRIILNMHMEGEIQKLLLFSSNPQCTYLPKIQWSTQLLPFTYGYAEMCMYVRLCDVKAVP